MQKIGAIPKSPNRYQQLSIIAFAICVSIRYGIIDYPLQRYETHITNAKKLQKKVLHPTFEVISFAMFLEFK